MRKRTFFWIALRLLAAAVWLWPDLTQAQADHRGGLLSAEAVREAAAAVTTNAYPDADDVLVDDYILAEYESDGRAVTWDDTFIKVLTEKGKRANAALSVRFTLPYEQASVELLQVIKADGRIVPVDIEEQSRVMVDPSQMGANIYNPNSKILQVGVPGLEIGDMVRYVTRQEIVQPRVPDTWSDYHLLEYTSPIKRFVYEVRGPKQRPLASLALKSEVPGTVIATRGEQDGRLAYRWEVRDVPQLFPEPNMPELYAVAQRLLVSTIPSWKEVSQWYWNLCEPHLAATEEMRARVSGLVDGLENGRAKIEAIFKFVSQEVRYMGITVETEAPGYEPHDVRLTFENRHGVCRDKAALLAALLRLAGFKAYPVLIHAGPKKDQEVPQPYFNHAVTAVEDQDGSYILMDSTDENTRELFPAYLSEKSYLVARPEGETLRVSPIVPAERNLMRIETRARLDARGTLSGQSTLEFGGINDNRFRGLFARLAPEQRRRFFEAGVKSLAAGARLAELRLEPADLQDTAQPLRAELVFEAEDVLASDGVTTLLPLPSLGQRVGMAGLVLRQTGLDRRRYPLRIDSACGVRETLQLELDPALGEVVALPQFPGREDETLTWRRQVTRENHRLTSQSDFLITTVEFSPEQYLDLKEHLKQIEYNERKMCILKSGASGASGEADVEVLDEEWLYDLRSARDYTVTHRMRQKILTYRGKKENAELKIAFNPVWEQAELIRATVANGEKVQEISPQEINLMDAAWVGGAPRYPAAKTLVASLPGVEIGSIIEYEVRREARDHPSFAVIHPFRQLDLVRRKTVRVEFPRELELRTRAEQIVTPQEEHGRRRSLAWSMENLELVKRESLLPPLWSLPPALLVSAADYRAYSREVNAALRQAASQQTNSARRAAELVAGLGSPAERLTATRDFVARNVRPAGPGLDDLPLSAITAADRTLTDAYGNSADRAVLLWAMLGAAGFEPEFVLASDATRVPALQQIQREVPLPGLFSTVLVRVKLENDFLYLNDTSQYAVLGATEHDGCLGLALDSGEIEVIRAQAGRETRLTDRYDIELEANGDARITRTRQYHGAAFAANNRRFSEMPPEERRRYFLEAVARISQAAKAEGELLTDFAHYPGVEQFTVAAEKFAVRDGAYFYFELPGLLPNLPGLAADQRSYPLYWDFVTDARLTITVRWPREWRRAILKPVPWSWLLPNQAGTVTLREIDPASIPVDPPDRARPDYCLEGELHLSPALVDAAAYPNLLEINRQLSHTRTRTILLGAGEAELR